MEPRLVLPPARLSCTSELLPRVAAAAVASLILRTRGVVATLIRLIANEINLRYPANGRTSSIPKLGGGSSVRENDDVLS